MPEYDNSWSVFDDNVHDFAEMFGLQDNWADYVSISLKLNGEDYSGLDDTNVEGYTYKAIRAGEYTVNFSLINAGNNVKFSSRPQPNISVSVDKYTLTIPGWIDNDEYSTPDVPNGVLPVYYDYRYVDEDGNILTADEMEVGSYYYREVYVKPAYEGSAEVKGETKFKFMMPVPPDVEKTPIAKPTLKADANIYYDGKDHVLNEEFLADLLENFDPEHMEIITAPTANAADSYTVTFKLTSGIYVWDNGDGTTSDGDLDISVTIKKAQLPSQWNEGGASPTIKVPSDFNGLVEFDYIYKDADGNEVAKEDLVAGVTYDVVAKLKPEYAGNFEFIGEGGQVTADAAI
ncbi:MAG: hypothetical protein K2I79_00930, partial [Clostridia bacterium]|nr:hypothetical protein [Clostridia bacterium]